MQWDENGEGLSLLDGFKMSLWASFSLWDLVDTMRADDDGEAIKERVGSIESCDSEAPR